MTGGGKCGYDGGGKYDGVCTGLLLLLNLMAVTRHSGMTDGVVQAQAQATAPCTIRLQSYCAHQFNLILKKTVFLLFDEICY